MRPGIIMVGAGGHAKVCIELLQAMGESVAYCVGDSESPEACLDIPVLRGDENLNDLRSKGYDKAFVAVGANHIRARLGTLCQEMGYQLVNAISPKAVISPSASLGHGIAVMAGVVINADSTIQNLVIVNTSASIDHDCLIGHGSHIAPQCALAGNVSVGSLSFLGIGCKVIPGVTLGDRVTVGAGGVVIRSFPSDVTVVGVPASIVAV